MIKFLIYDKDRTLVLRNSFKIYKANIDRLMKKIYKSILIKGANFCQ